MGIKWTCVWVSGLVFGVGYQVDLCFGSERTCACVWVPSGLVPGTKWTFVWVPSGLVFGYQVDLCLGTKWICVPGAK